MRKNVNLSAIRLALIAVAFLSLLVMLLLNRLDQLVHNVLYSFGLQFSYTWAMPYWVNSALVIGLSWFNIIASFALIWYLYKRPKQPRPTTQGGSYETGMHRGQRKLDAYAYSGEHKPQGATQQPVQAFEEGSAEASIQAQVWEAAPQVNVWDVRRPKDVVDSQC
ncbi:MAG: hypothetical protein NWE81_04075 [Candidatus Bathyarchaeota archaeon]|nr:hypothetical protein [Candidatus Bathyarchaeota archaeon]